MTKIVLDTNVILSALLFGGKPRKVFEMAIEGRIRLSISEPILDEIRNVLIGRKFSFPKNTATKIIAEIETIADIVETHSRLCVVHADPDDNRILECAVDSGAEYIVSGDSHLLDIGSWNDIRIVNPDDFLKHIQ